MDGLPGSPAMREDMVVLFERFTEDARCAVVRSQEEARSRGDRYLGTEHLLLGTIARGGGRGALLLRSVGITEKQVRAAVRDAAPRGNQRTGDAVVFTGSASRALQLAVREADGLRHGAVDTDHLLIALAGVSPVGPSEQEATSVRVLRALGVGAAILRSACEGAAGREQPRRSAPVQDPAQRVADQLERLSSSRLRTDRLLNALTGALDLAEEEAIYFGRPAADGGDLLMGLAAGPDALVGRALSHLGLDPERVRAAVEHARKDEPRT